ncbi:hypothetical protein RchiOBHm_Chr6g0263421 [Rosa chinensis]|uniref:Uncharacterized protein n=1 Tax=Rosa chinensis TaxID=74649 RepID=A0A2P6PNZ0_ROSCH|nr:hypothetical protein RchiOBHm_Chr6g0263421 [Rosa chinensis]
MHTAQSESPIVGCWLVGFAAGFGCSLSGVDCNTQQLVNLLPSLNVYFAVSWLPYPESRGQELACWKL